MHSRTLSVSLALLAALAVPACQTKTASPPASSSAETKAATGYQANLEKLETFFDAGKKSGAFTSQTLRDDGSRPDAETAKFWVDGRRFRIEYFKKDGTKRIAIVSPDGQTAYFVRPDEKVSEPAVASVDHYIAWFTRPEGKLEDAGADAKTGEELLRYVVKKVEDIKGATNAYYTEDYVYHFKDGDLAAIVSRGNTLANGKVKDKMDTYTYRFTQLAVGGDIPAKTFELEYPKK